MHRFIINQTLSKGKMIFARCEAVHQIKDVLCLHIGERIIVCDGIGHEAEGEIIGLDKKSVQINISNVRINNKESKRFVTLYCAVLKRENFEWVVQKATEVGIKKIVPIISNRTVKSSFNLARIKKIIQEATEQSGRGVLPEIVAPVTFQKALLELSEKQLNLFCHFGGEEFKIIKFRNEPIGIWVGPEGGWTEKEVETAQAKNFKIVTLGKTVLRAETAATIASFLAVNL